MSLELVKTIHKKINTFHDILYTIMPKDKLSHKVTEYYKNEYEVLFECLDTLIKNSKSKQSQIIKECEFLEEEIRKKTKNLEIKFLEIANFTNLDLKREYLLNEYKKICILEKRLDDDIIMWSSRVTNLYAEISTDSIVFESKQITKNYLINLKKKYECINEEKIKKETKKKEILKAVKEYKKILCIEDYIPLDIKFSDLEGKYNLYKKIMNTRQNELNDLKSKILRLEELLKIPISIVENTLSDFYINTLKDRVLLLDEEYKKKLDEIYNDNYNTLQELSNLFGLDIQIYEKNDEGINRMKIKTKELELKKESYMEINDIIEKRYILLESMNEFEKIASDPKRLFKSSFQLNREEKFRKSAYPSLLKLESDLLKKLEEYNNKHNKFIKDGIDIEEIIKKEISSRIINKTVFINKFDSPYKKKKI